jgi:hypothetical protein
MLLQVSEYGPCIAKNAEYDTEKSSVKKLKIK